LKINHLKVFFALSIELLCFFVVLYTLCMPKPEGLLWLFLLPFTFALIFPILYKISWSSKNSLFFIAFSCVSFLRYVVEPFLHVFTNDYSGPRIRITIHSNSWFVAIFLMVYELVITAIVLYVFLNKMKKKQKLIVNQVSNGTQYTLVGKYTIYNILFLVTAVAVLMYPDALSYFSFLNFGMQGVDLSELTTMTQITIMLLVTSKLLGFPVLISIIKKKHDKSPNKFFYEFLAFIITILSGATYYGGNRAQFLFSIIYSVYVFLVLFPKHKKLVLTSTVVLGIFILLFMTEERNYGEVYTNTTGFKRTILEFLDTINQYFGGLTNVATSVQLKAHFTDKQNIFQLIKDCLIPIVGINKLIPFNDLLISNTFFNYIFFNGTRNVTQILPSIGHGYFIFGFAFAPILDVIQLIIAYKLYTILNKTNRIELVYIFNIVLMRFSLMFGQNITQQINGLSMQLMLPIIVYAINNKFVLRNKD